MQGHRTYLTSAYSRVIALHHSSNMVFMALGLLVMLALPAPGAKLQGIKYVDY